MAAGRFRNSMPMGPLRGVMNFVRSSEVVQYVARFANAREFKCVSVAMNGKGHRESTMIHELQAMLTTNGAPRNARKRRLRGWGRALHRGASGSAVEPRSLVLQCVWQSLWPRTGVGAIVQRSMGNLMLASRRAPHIVNYIVFAFRKFD